MSKDTARVIVTYKCNRACPGCCNGNKHEAREINSTLELKGYDTIILTGGEPMLNPDVCTQLIEVLRNQGWQGKVILYTASYDGSEAAQRLIKACNGITYTLHNELSQKDREEFEALTEFIGYFDSEFTTRVNVDSRLFADARIPRNSISHYWDDIVSKEWVNDCPVPDNEELLYFELI